MESQEKLHSETQNEVKNSEQTPESILEINEETTENIDEVVSDDLTLVSEEEILAATDEEVAPIAEEEVSIEAELEAEPVIEEEVASEIVEEVAPIAEEEVSIEAELEAEPVIEEEVTSEIVEEVAPVEEAIATEEEVEIAPETEAVVEEVKVEEVLLSEEIVIDEELILEEEIEDVDVHVDVDYSTYSEFELVAELRNLMAEPNFLAIMSKVDSVKINFYKKQKAKIQEEKKKFIDEGGFEEDFVTEENPYEVELKTLLADYRHKKILFNKDIEADKEKNLAVKYAIIEEIKGLVNRKESINKTFQEFKELQIKWREVGLVPQANMKDLWENYHHHVENFYDYIKINKELRDLDLKKNLEEKILLCEKAEALIIEPSVIKAFNTLQKLHDSWREIGPVPRDKKEEVWERFKDATTQINKKHQDFFENRKKSQKKNLDAKTALCDKVEEILTENLATHKDFEDKSKELVELQKYWRTIGFAPKKENDEIYDRFRKACDGFFDVKREFYSKHKDVQNNNLQMKMDLCVQAESLRESTDWKKTTDELIAIQKRWKEIGPVPRKNSDILWKRFRTACDDFFNKKATFFNSKDEIQNENLRLKNELIEEVISFKSEGKDQDDFERLRELQRRWMEVGHVPISVKDSIQKRFREAINKEFEKLRVDDKDRSLMRFKSKMSDLKTSNRGNNKMFAERDKNAAKLKQMESDLITLKNNIGFFSNSKNAEALIKDVQQKIQNTEEQIIYLRDKIRVIDDVDYTEA